MIKVEDFFKELTNNNIEFYTGVPDSLLKDICAYIADNVSANNNVIAANEGAAIALGAGYYLATKKTPLIYMQNSGIGNAINPLLSLADKKVYSLPMILMIGWRGEPNVKDEPQHIKQGQVTTQLLESIGIPHWIVDAESDFHDIISSAVKQSKEDSIPVALIIRKNTFSTYKLQNIQEEEYDLTREHALATILNGIEEEAIIVSTTGMLSRELYELRKLKQQSHKSDFLTVGSMGHASQIALGISMQKPDRKVYCFDGDGALLMHTGSLAIIGSIGPKNLVHVLFNNSAHDSVGGQPTIGNQIDFQLLAKACCYKHTRMALSENDIHEMIEELKQLTGPSFLEIKICKGARPDLGRPESTPIQNKEIFMQHLDQ